MVRPEYHPAVVATPIALSAVAIATSLIVGKVARGDALAFWKQTIPALLLTGPATYAIGYKIACATLIDSKAVENFPLADVTETELGEILEQLTKSSTEQLWVGQTPTGKYLPYVGKRRHKGDTKQLCHVAPVVAHFLQVHAEELEFEPMAPQALATLTTLWRDHDGITESLGEVAARVGPRAVLVHRNEGVLDALRDDQATCDVVINCKDDRDVEAHWLILKQLTWFGTPMRHEHEKRIFDLTQFDADTVGIALDMIYGRGAQLALNDAEYRVLGELLTYIGADGQRAALRAEIERPIIPRLRDGDSTLHKALKENDWTRAALLIFLGAPVTARNDRQSTPMIEAAKRGQERIVRLLIEHGGDVSATTNRGVSPVILAAQYGHRAVCEQLLLAGGNVHQTAAPHNATALHCAAHAGHADVVNLLLEHGANPQHEANGWTAARHARHNGHNAIAQVLEEAAAAMG